MKIVTPKGKELEVTEKTWNLIYSKLDGYEKVETKGKKAEGKKVEGEKAEGEKAEGEKAEGEKAEGSGQKEGSIQ